MNETAPSDLKTILHSKRANLYYLEHWSIAFDIKILTRTLLAFKNAC